MLLIGCFQKQPKDGAESALFCNMSTGPMDVYKVKCSHDHLLASFESKREGAPIGNSKQDQVTSSKRGRLERFTTELSNQDLDRVLKRRYKRPLLEEVA